MFKNRVRTAALAGAIAVATGVSGIVVVPANAQLANPETGTQGTNPQTDNKQNPQDSSKPNSGNAANNIAPINGATAVEQLRKKVEADQKAINALNPIVNYEPSANRPVESEAMKDAQDREAAATTVLNQANATLAAVNATVKAVEAEIKAANQAWARYATAVTLTPEEKDAIVKLAVDLNAPQAVQDAAKDLPVNFGVLGGDNYVRDTQDARAELFTDQDSILKFDAAVREWIGTRNSTAEGVDNANKATQVYNKLWGYLGDDFDQRDKLLREALRLTETATSRNIVELEQIAAQARAQVRALRVIQAYYGLAARWLDLYEDDVLTTDEITTLRDNYRQVLFTNATDVDPEAGSAVADEDLYQQAAWAAANIKGKKTTDEWNAYSLLKWENSVQKVRQLDKRYKGDAEAKAAADAAKAAEAKDLNTQLAKLADAATKLAETQSAAQNNSGTKPADNTKPGNDTKPGNNTDVNVNVDGGKKLSPAAIAGIVLGVVVALGGIVAVAFPQIQHMLPKF